MELEDVKVELAELKEVSRELNEWGGAEKKVKLVAIKRENLIESFMTAVESVPENQEINIPKVVADLYNSLSAQLEDSPESDGTDVETEPDATAETDAAAETDATAETETGATSEDTCPVFKKGWDPENSDCQACAKAYPEEYKKCEEACVVTPVKAKREKKDRKKREGGGSTKSIIWTEWEKAGKTKNAEDLQKEFGPDVKVKTVKAWIRSWTNGKCLPGGAK